MARRRHLLHQDWVAQLSALAPDSLLREVRRQSRPRRWPWQPKTLRDLIDERSADLLELAAERSAELADLLAQRRDDMADELRKQAQPRRFPWQKKTARDHVDARMSELTERAAERAAELAALAGTRRDNVVRALERQAKPRRFPWQQKTARDRVDSQLAALTQQASAQRDLVAQEAAMRRDALLAELERERSPRRWPWQPKTLRDRAEERLAELAGMASSRRDDLRSQTDDLLTKADEHRRRVAASLERERSPRRWPWQPKTLRDRAEERLGALVDDAAARGEDMRGQADDLLAMADERRKQLRSDFERERRPRRWPWQPKTLRDRADERLGDIEAYIRDARASGGDTGLALQDALKAAPAAIGAAATTAVDGMRGSADSTATAIRDGVSDVGKRIGDTTDNAAASVRAAAHVPVDALNRKVESGKRTVRWTVRIGKFTFWALLIGAAIGILYSPRSGREMRQEIRFNINRFLDMILPVE